MADKMCHSAFLGTPQTFTDRESPLQIGTVRPPEVEHVLKPQSFKREAAVPRDSGDTAVLMGRDSGILKECIKHREGEYIS